MIAAGVAVGLVDAAHVTRTFKVPAHAAFAAGQAPREKLRTHSTVATERSPGKFMKERS